MTMESWFRSNSLKMNPTKTDFILTGSRPNIKNKNFQPTIGNAPMSPSRSLRLLGVVIDPFLSWDSHISQVVKKCNALLISLYRFRHHFTQDMLKLLIETHVFPHILYCLSVWGGAAKNQSGRIQKVINFAARVVTGARRRDRISPALRALGWDRFEGLVEVRDLIKVYKALHHELGPPAVRGMFVARSAVSSRVTRSTEAGHLELPRYDLTVARRTFRYRATVAWNRLPLSVAESRSLTIFKHAIKDIGDGEER